MPNACAKILQCIVLGMLLLEKWLVSSTFFSLLGQRLQYRTFELKVVVRSHEW